MKFGIAMAFAVMSAAPIALAQPMDTAPIDGPAQAPAGSIEIPLYGKGTPGNPADTIEMRFMGRETVLRNITYPTLTPVLPAPGKANGTAVIVAPGGGFAILAMQNEGWRVAQALADRGIAAFVLKYRLNPTARDEKAFFVEMGRFMAEAGREPGKAPDIKGPNATKDAQAALRMVRDRAAEWHVDPKRVGMIGFSAGAMTTLNTVLEADSTTAPPDFIGYIYGPMNAVTVPMEAPPMFAALAMDDPLFGNGQWPIASAWLAAKRPVELHVYESGGHGFGLGRPDTTSTQLMPQFLAWMDMHGLLTAKVRP